MSISDDLITVAENQKKVYDAGFAAGQKAGGGSSVKTITFTIKSGNSVTSIPCMAQSGMTWGEWLDSEYNTINAQVDPDLVVIFCDFVDENGDILEGMVIVGADGETPVTPTEVIVAGGTYSVI